MMLYPKPRCEQSSNFWTLRRRDISDQRNLPSRSKNCTESRDTILCYKSNTFQNLNQVSLYNVYTRIAAKYEAI